MSEAEKFTRDLTAFSRAAGAYEALSPEEMYGIEPDDRQESNDPPEPAPWTARDDAALAGGAQDAADRAYAAAARRCVCGQPGVRATVDGFPGYRCPVDGKEWHG